MTGYAAAHQPPLDEPDPNDVEQLADLIERARSRPGLVGHDTLAYEILRAGYQPPTGKGRP